MNGSNSLTHEKAHQINSNSMQYGSFAEIGAGQEVARWFFQVGGAAKTIAKSISAYDMKISDSLYGPAQRYVSRQRLEAMLKQEFHHVLEGLSASRGANSTFFAFADTVATRKPGHAENGRGWVGIRFQTKPFEEPSQIIAHVHLLEPTAVLEQQTLGVLGVNLIHAAFNHRNDLSALVAALTDDLPTERFDLDMLKVSGPAFEGVDNRLLSLQLVEQKLTDAAMFTSDCEVVQPSEVLYNKPILVVRGSFRPATKLTVDLLERARDLFVKEPENEGSEVVVLAEMTLNNLLSSTGVSHDDFLERAQILHALGIDVLISNFQPYYQLADYLACYTNRMIGIAVGLPGLREILDEQYYDALGGGALESIGRLFKRSVKMYVYPAMDPATGRVTLLEDAPFPHPSHHLRDLLLDLHRVELIEPYRVDYLPIQPPDVLAMLQSGDPAWEHMVPPVVAQCIKDEKLLGYTG
jgi:hypothetical protein